MTTLTSPASVTPGDDASQLFQQQRHMGDDGQPKMEYSTYGAPQVMHSSYTPDLGDGSGNAAASQGYTTSGTAKEEPMYATPSESDVSGASTAGSTNPHGRGSGQMRETACGHGWHGQAPIKGTN